MTVQQPRLAICNAVLLHSTSSSDKSDSFVKSWPNSSCSSIRRESYGEKKVLLYHLKQFKCMKKTWIYEFSF